MVPVVHVLEGFATLKTVGTESSYTVCLLLSVLDCEAQHNLFQNALNRAHGIVLVSITLFCLLVQAYLLSYPFLLACLAPFRLKGIDENLNLNSKYIPRCNRSPHTLSAWLQLSSTPKRSRQANMTLSTFPFKSLIVSSYPAEVTYRHFINLHSRRKGRGCTSASNHYLSLMLVSFRRC